MFEVVDKNHKYFKLTVEELEQRLNKHLNSEAFAGVVDIVN